jgi:hypothetical protein
MNWFQRYMVLLFNWEYVFLVSSGKGFLIRKATRIGSFWFANPYLPETRRKLLPGGVVAPSGYILRWEPITPGTQRFFDA